MDKENRISAGFHDFYALNLASKVGQNDIKGQQGEERGEAKIGPSISWQLESSHYPEIIG